MRFPSLSNCCDILGDILRATGNLAGRSANFVLKKVTSGLGDGLSNLTNNIGDGIEDVTDRIGAGKIGSGVNNVLSGVGSGVGNTVKGGKIFSFLKVWKLTKTVCFS